MEKKKKVVRIPFTQQEKDLLTQAYQMHLLGLSKEERLFARKVANGLQTYPEENGYMIKNIQKATDEWLVKEKELIEAFDSLGNLSKRKEVFQQLKRAILCITDEYGRTEEGSRQKLNVWKSLTELEKLL